MNYEQKIKFNINEIINRLTERDKKKKKKKKKEEEEENFIFSLHFKCYQNHLQ